MRLIDNWRGVLRHALSVHGMILAAVLSGIEVAMPYLDGLLPIPRGVFAALSGVVTFGALVARFVVQKSLHKQDSGDTNADQ